MPKPLRQNINFDVNSLSKIAILVHYVNVMLLFIDYLHLSVTFTMAE